MLKHLQILCNKYNRIIECSIYLWITLMTDQVKRYLINPNTYIYNHFIQINTEFSNKIINIKYSVYTYVSNIYGLWNWMHLLDNIYIVQALGNFYKRKYSIDFHFYLHSELQLILIINLIHMKRYFCTA